MKLIQNSLVSLVLITLGVANAWEPTEHCGSIIRTAKGWDEILIVCPNLPNLTEEQIWEAIVDLLNKASNYEGHNRIFFFSDDPSRGSSHEPEGEKSGVRNWGGTLIGHYHSRNGILSLRDSDEQWTEIRLPPVQ